MNLPKLTRAEFLRLAAVSAFAALLAGCRRTMGKTTTSSPISTAPAPTHSAIPTHTSTAAATAPPSNTQTPSPTTTQTPTPATTPTQPSDPVCLHLLSPADGSQLPRIGRITFTWEAYPAAAGYRIDFTAPNGKVVSFKSAAPKHDRYAESLPWGGEFTWQVTALDAGGRALCTANPWRFSKPQPPPTDVPHNASTEDEDTAAGVPGSGGIGSSDGGPVSGGIGSSDGGPVSGGGGTSDGDG